jgi:hypothetical protein
MAFKAKDGKAFGNRQQMKVYDERPAKKEPKGVEAQHEEPDGDEGSDQDIHEVVAEHGPADKIQLHHDDDAGKHHVISHHGEHVHKVVKAGREEAHEHAKIAAGLSPEQQEEEQQPAMAGGGAMQGGGIPGM